MQQKRKFILLSLNIENKKLRLPIKTSPNEFAQIILQSINELASFMSDVQSRNKKQRINHEVRSIIECLQIMVMIAIKCLEANVLLVLITQKRHFRVGKQECHLRFVSVVDVLPRVSQINGRSIKFDF